MKVKDINFNRHDHVHSCPNTCTIASYSPEQTGGTSGAENRLEF